MPPNPAPMKLALGFRGATQQRNARDLSIGKAYSGRNCQKITAVSTAKKTYICFLDVDDGCSLWFFCVSKRAVWQRLKMLIFDQHLSSDLKLTLGTWLDVSSVE
jgi:hypothetical protein